MPRRILRGKVVSDTNPKTVVVNVERVYLHPLLKKTVRRSKRYHAHDESNAIKVGELVEIRECPPRSKLKRWEVLTADMKATADNAKPTGKGKVEAPADASESSRPADNAPQKEGTQAHAPGANA